jgi:hypothetical protein
MNLVDPYLARQPWAGITPGSTGDIVTADLRELRHIRLNQTPIEGKSSTHNHNRGTSLASAIYVYAVSANVDQLTERWWSRLGLRRDRQRQQQN